VAGERDRLLAYAFHKIAVAHESVGEVIDDLRVVVVVDGA